MRSLRVLISSPGETAEEQSVAQTVIERLSTRFGSVELVSTLQPDLPTHGDADWANQFYPPSQADIYICLLHDRLGSRPVHHSDALNRFESFTHFEAYDAMRSGQTNNRPTSLFYRRSKLAPVVLRDPKDAELRTERWNALQQFWKTHQPLAREHIEFRSYSQLSELQSILTSDLERAFSREIQDVSSSRPNGDRCATIWNSICKGLNEYQEADRSYLMGQTQTVAQIQQSFLKQVQKQNPFLLLIGPKASGKSSLVRAGLMPQLGQISAEHDVNTWRHAEVRFDWPIANPFRLLAYSLTREGGLPELLDRFRSIDGLKAALENDPNGTVLAIREVLDEIEERLLHSNWFLGKPKARLFLTLDQVGLLARNPKIDASRRESFWKIIRRMIAQRVVWVVAVAEVDDYGALTESETFLKLKEDGGHFDLRHPTQLQWKNYVNECTPLLASLPDWTEYSARAFLNTITAQCQHDAQPLATLQMFLAIARFNGPDRAYECARDKSTLSEQFINLAFEQANFGGDEIRSLARTFSKESFKRGSHWRRSESVLDDFIKPHHLATLRHFGLLKEGFDVQGLSCTTIRDLPIMLSNRDFQSASDSDIPSSDSEVNLDDSSSSMIILQPSQSKEGKEDSVDSVVLNDSNEFIEVNEEHVPFDAASLELADHSADTETVNQHKINTTRSRRYLALAVTLSIGILGSTGYVAYHYSPSLSSQRTDVTRVAQDDSVHQQTAPSPGDASQSMKAELNQPKAAANSNSTKKNITPTQNQASSQHQTAIARSEPSSPNPPGRDEATAPVKPNGESMTVLLKKLVDENPTLKGVCHIERAEVISEELVLTGTVASVSRKALLRSETTKQLESIAASAGLPVPRSVNVIKMKVEFK